MADSKQVAIKTRILAFLGAWIIRAWCFTLRVRIFPPLDPHGKPIDLCQESFILAFWHDSLLIPLWLMPRLKLQPAVLISKSGDGELVARVCLQSGWKVVRGSSSRGGAEALNEATSLYQPGKPYRFTFTVDGPRGPRRECKFGVVALAARLGLPVLPITIHPENAWHARSWDQMAIPKPFSRVVVKMDSFIQVPSPATPDQLELARQEVQRSLTTSTPSLSTQLPNSLRRQDRQAA